MSELATQGYQVCRNVLSADEISSLRESITETIDRVANALRAPFSKSRPDAPFEERVELVAREDRAYALALFRAAMADAHRDSRMEKISEHPQLTAIINALISPMERTSHVIRPRASVQSLSIARSPWHQDVIQPSTSPTSCGAVRLACWIRSRMWMRKPALIELIPGAWPSSLPHSTNHEGHFFIPEEHLPVEGRRSMPLRAGDVLILDRFVPHRSLPLQQPCARWAVAMWVKAA